MEKSWISPIGVFSVSLPDFAAKKALWRQWLTQCHFVTILFKENPTLIFLTLNLPCNQIRDIFCIVKIPYYARVNWGKYNFHKQYRYVCVKNLAVVRLVDFAALSSVISHWLTTQLISDNNRAFNASSSWFGTNWMKNCLFRIQHRQRNSSWYMHVSQDCWNWHFWSHHF